MSSVNKKSVKNKTLKKLVIVMLFVVPIIFALRNWEPVRLLTYGSEYANDTIKYIDDLRSFSTKLEDLSNEANKDDLEDELTLLSGEIIEFERQEKPKLFESIHNELLKRNGELKVEVDRYLGMVKNGETDINNTNILEKIGTITVMLNENNELVDDWKTVK